MPNDDAAFERALSLANKLRLLCQDHELLPSAGQKFGVQPWDELIKKYCSQGLVVTWENRAVVWENVWLKYALDLLDAVRAEEAKFRKG